ncbi:MAG TPA: SAM-dependent chlorinase/fluorinase [Dehalococcoidia bacterium]|nr:SAM-dependent chlorinase/fluorinase [Dehalococcoidia bacterium]
MAGIITITTDFGLSDGYVAAMKGAILDINPEVNVVDICHNIKPQNISQAAFVLSTAYLFFPKKTIHLVVVDPGVGTERQAIILRTPLADFVAPDNGVLSYVIEHFTGQPVTDDSDVRQTKVRPEVEAVVLTEPRFWRTPVSPTFHGRDIFAPVAAFLSLGFPPINFGKAITSVTMLPLPRPHQALDGSVLGHVLHIDGFGNLITDIRGDDLPETAGPLNIEIGRHAISGLSRTYAEGKGLLALIGSSGYLEISLKGGSAHAFLEVEVGGEIRVKKVPGRSQE